MTINEYQEKAVSFAQYGGNAMYPALGLAEEAGEVAGKVAKFIRKHGGLGPDTAARSFPHAAGGDIYLANGGTVDALGKTYEYMKGRFTE